MSRLRSFDRRRFFIILISALDQGELIILSMVQAYLLWNW